MTTAESFTILYMVADLDESEAVERRHDLMDKAEALGFEIVGANTRDCPRYLALREVMGADWRKRDG